MYMNEQLLSKSVMSDKDHGRHQGRVSNSRLAKFTALLTVGLLILVLSLCLSLFGGDRDVFAASNGSQTQRFVDVVKGDTLWSIANQHVKKGQSVPEYISELKRVNHLTSNILHEGQVLILP